MNGVATIVFSVFQLKFLQTFMNSNTMVTLQIALHIYTTTSQRVQRDCLLLDTQKSNQV